MALSIDDRFQRGGLALGKHCARAAGKLGYFHDDLAMAHGLDPLVTLRLYHSTR